MFDITFEHFSLSILTSNVGFRAGTQKILARIAYSADPDQTAASVCVGPF